MASNNAAEQATMPLFNPNDLTAGELEYEFSIRPEYDGDRNAAAMEAIMAQERVDGIDASTWGVLNEAEEATDDIALDTIRLAMQVWSESADCVVASTGQRTEEAYRHRLKHYEMRIGRLPEVFRSTPNSQLILSRIRKMIAKLDGMMAQYMGPPSLHSTMRGESTAPEATTSTADAPLSHRKYTESAQAQRDTETVPASQDTAVQPEGNVTTTQANTSAVANATTHEHLPMYRTPVPYASMHHDYTGMPTPHWYIPGGQNTGQVPIRVPGAPPPVNTIPLLPCDFRRQAAPAQINFSAAATEAPHSAGTQQPRYGRAPSVADHSAMSNAPATSLTHENMAIRRYLGTRLFDGTRIRDSDGTNTKVYSLEELVDTIQGAHEAVQCSEGAILRNLTFSLSGQARTWWKANRHKITSLHECEEAIRKRFDSQASTPQALLRNVYCRKQGTTEHLPKFIDEMNVLMDRALMSDADEERLDLIIANANEQCQPLLHARQARSMVELIQFANTFPEAKATKSATARSFRFEKKVQALQEDSEHELTNDGSSESESEEVIDVQALKKLIRSMEGRSSSKRAVTLNQSRRTPSHKAEPAGIAHQEPTVLSHTMEAQGNEAMICWNCGHWGHPFKQCRVKTQRVFCYGCGRPNTIARDCQTCQQTKNGQAGPELTVLPTDAQRM